MALITLVSASGSPGVTTTALGLALTWSRPVMLVEADPTGGSALLAGYLRGAATPPDSLIDLALAHRGGGLVKAVPQVARPLPGSRATFISGTRSHAQAPSLVPLWGPLSGVLKGLEATGQDVIVDAGRLGLVGSPEPLIYASDLALLVTRSDLVSLSGARSWAATVGEEFARLGAPSAFGVLMVGQGDPYRAREVSRVLGVPVLAALAWDQPVAAVLARGAEVPKAGLLGRLAGRGALEDSALLRSLRAAGTAAQTRVTNNREQLEPIPAGRQQ